MWIRDGFKVGNDSTKRSAYDILRLGRCQRCRYGSSRPGDHNFSTHIQNRVSIEAVYAPYVEQQTAAMKVFQKDENLRLPLEFKIRSDSRAEYA